MTLFTACSPGMVAVFLDDDGETFHTRPVVGYVTREVHGAPGYVEHWAAVCDSDGSVVIARDGLSGDELNFVTVRPADVEEYQLSPAQERAANRRIDDVRDGR